MSRLFFVYRPLSLKFLSKKFFGYLCVKKNMDLIIDGSLTAPPSQVYCFRDISLYVKCFLDRNIFVECKKDEIDLYWYWLKRNNAYDFVDGMVRSGEVIGFKIGPKRKSNLKIESIDYYNQSFVLKNISKMLRI